MAKAPKFEGRTFRERPDLNEIKSFVLQRELYGVKKDKSLEITDIDSKSPSGHWNFLIKQGDSKFVFRLVGDEKPISGDEIEKEYKILEHAAPYRVGPKPYYFSKTDFKEPFLVEEFLDGKLFTQLDVTEQKNEFPKVAELIAKINDIPITEELRQYLQPIKGYDWNFQTWQNRLIEISTDSQYNFLKTKIEKILPESQKSITRYSESLKLAPEKFIFKSAHVGHCIKTDSGLRFLNWEEVGYGDPSYSLAVFLASVRNRDDFKEIKNTMIKSYLRQNNSIKEKELRDLLDARLFERLVSDTIWPVWMAAIQRRALLDNEIEAVEQRLEDIKKTLKSN